MQQTANIHHAPQEELRRLSEEIRGLEGMLRGQHEILRQRGMSTPAGVLERLDGVQADMAALAQQMGEDFIELDQLRAIVKTTQLLNSTLEPDEVLTEVVDTAIALTGAERAYIVLRSSRTGELEFRIARDYQRQNLPESKFTASRSVMRQVAETGEPVVTLDALMDERFDGQASIVLHAPRSILCVPLIYRGKVSGVLYADNRQVTSLFGEAETALLLAFANQAAIAIENARMFDRVRRALVEITEMKDLMANVLASIASGVITTDRANTIITYNRAAEAILGVPYQQAIHQPVQSILPSVFAGFGALLDEAREADRPQVVELEPVLPDRGAVNLSLKLAPLKDPQGVTYGMAVVVDDVTEIRKRDATLNVVRTYLPPSLVRNIQSIDGLGLSGDEREISVIFADVRGFTTFSEQLPPEQLMEVINGYLTVASEAIQLYEGIIDKYMGDAVVGLFNTQLNPQEDHAERAVRAALMMAYDVRALHEVLPPEQRLFYGIGVDTGAAVIGNVGSPSRKEFTAIGLPVNFAKLLQENAQAGEIIISQSAFERVKHLFAAEPLAPRKVKGYQNFEVMYRVTGLNRPRPTG